MLEQIQTFRAAFAETGLQWKKNNAYIAVVVKQKDGKLRLCELGAGPCHGALAYSSLRYQMLEGEQLEVILSQVQELRASQADSEKFIDWLVNRSAWADVFLTKDVKDILKYGYVARTDLSNNLVAGAMIATRFITESYSGDICERIPVYKELLDAGCTEAEAYIFSHVLSAEKPRARSPYPIIVSALYSGHEPFGVGSKSVSYFKNFLTGKVANPKTTFKERKGYESGIYGTWGGDSDKTFTSFCRKLKPRSAQMAVNYNIFEKKKDSGFAITNQIELRDIVAQMKEAVYA